MVLEASYALLLSRESSTVVAASGKCSVPRRPHRVILAHLLSKRAASVRRKGEAANGAARTPREDGHVHSTLSRIGIPTGTWKVDKAHTRVWFAVKHWPIADATLSEGDRNAPSRVEVAASGSGLGSG